MCGCTYLIIRAIRKDDRQKREAQAALAAQNAQHYPPAVPVTMQYQAPPGAPVAQYAPQPTYDPNAKAPQQNGYST